MKIPTNEDLPLMPQWPGVGLLYPGGAPMQMENMRYEGKTYEQMKRDFIMFRVDKGPALKPIELEILQQWLVYYVHSPLFNMDAEMRRFNAPLRKLAWDIKPTVESINDFLHKAMNYGLDPF
jgi:hypothetical protein